MPQKQSKKIIEKIRREVTSGKTKYRVAIEMNLDFSYVYRHSKDIPSHKPKEPSISGKAVNLLKQLLNDGYVHSTKENNPALRRLRNNFPMMIQRSQIEGKGVYYLNDKNRIALRSVLEQKKSRLIDYNDLSRTAKVFNIDLTQQEKKSFIGKKNTKHRRKFQRSGDKSHLENEDSLVEYYMRNLCVWVSGLGLCTHAWMHIFRLFPINRGELRSFVHRNS